MKAVIILFSPSGNTNRVGELLKEELVRKNISVQLINIARNANYFFARDKHKFLAETISEHDILLIGAPVFAHHLQYHMKDLIQSLPQPTKGWGKVAIPFVTYGGIHSGIALEEAGQLLRKSGRTILAGLKVSSSHRMSRAFMEEEYNKDQPEDLVFANIEKLVQKIQSIDLDSLSDHSDYLKYQSRKTFLKANIIFREKLWHKNIYPKILIDHDTCIKCGKCIHVCPVCHLEQDNHKKVIRNTGSPCIHCFNCFVACPKNAISADGDLERAKDFMQKMIAKGTEIPKTCLYSKE